MIPFVISCPYSLPDENNVERVEDAVQMHVQGNHHNNKDVVVQNFGHKKTNLLSMEGLEAVNSPVKKIFNNEPLSNSKQLLATTTVEEESSREGNGELVVPSTIHIHRPLHTSKEITKDIEALLLTEPTSVHNNTTVPSEPTGNQQANDGIEEQQPASDESSESQLAYEPKADETKSNSSIGDPTSKLEELMKMELMRSLDAEQKEALLCVGKSEANSTDQGQSIEEQNNELSHSVTDLMYEPMADEPTKAEKQNSDLKQETEMVSVPHATRSKTDVLVKSQSVPPIECDSKPVNSAKKPSSDVNPLAKEQKDFDCSNSHGQDSAHNSDISSADALFRKGTPDHSSDDKSDSAPSQSENLGSRVSRSNSPVTDTPPSLMVAPDIPDQTNEGEGKVLNQAPAQRYNLGSRVTKSPVSAFAGTSPPLMKAPCYDPQPQQELVDLYAASVDQGTKKHKVKKKSLWGVSSEEVSLTSYISSFSSSCGPPIAVTPPGAFPLASIERQYGKHTVYNQHLELNWFFRFFLLFFLFLFFLHLMFVISDGHSFFIGSSSLAVGKGVPSSLLYQGNLLEHLVSSTLNALSTTGNGCYT